MTKASPVTPRAKEGRPHDRPRHAALPVKGQSGLNQFPDWLGVVWSARRREVGRTHHQLVYLAETWLFDEPLKIPCRATLSATRRRLSEADVVLRTKHLHECHAAAYTEIPRLRIAQVRESERQFERKGRIMSKVPLIIRRSMSSQLAMGRRHSTHPHRLCVTLLRKTAKLNIERLRVVDVVRPE